MLLALLICARYEAKNFQPISHRNGSCVHKKCDAKFDKIFIPMPAVHTNNIHFESMYIDLNLNWVAEMRLEREWQLSLLSVSKEW